MAVLSPRLMVGGLDFYACELEIYEAAAMDQAPLGRTSRYQRLCDLRQGDPEVQLSLENFQW